MKRIAILGSGLSATSLINYLLQKSEEYNWEIKVASNCIGEAKSKVKNHPNAEAVKFNVNDENEVKDMISWCEVAVSLVPARFHPIIANECLLQSKHMVTASYVSKEIAEMDTEAKEKGIAILNELGVDPGIDHMSAMRVIDMIRDKGGKMLAFKSSTGGLIAPEYDTNPWNYKFTWNPRNVVLAGQGVATFKEKGKYKYIPYQQLFKRTEKTTVLDLGDFEIYPNRDSLSYRKTYGLEEIPTIKRGTMRRPGYCEAWDVFVQMGLTDDSYVYEAKGLISYREFLNSFLRYQPKKPVEDKICELLHIKHDSEVMKKLEWLGIFGDKKIDVKGLTPAQVLQEILVNKWVLEPEDKDMIVMQHKFEYELENEIKGIKSSFALIGKDQTETAMAITVGTPLAIAVKQLMTGKIKLTGVHTPVIPELYNPILDELEEYGIKFVDEEYVPE